MNRSQLNNTKWIGVLILILIVAKGLFLLKPRPLLWDEAVYIAMGKYLMSGGQIGLFEEIRPPVMPLIFGFIWKTGFPQIYYAQIIEILFSAVLILVVYLIAKKVFDERVALLAAITLSISPTYFFFAGYTLSDIPSTLFALCAVLFFINQRLIMTGIFCGIALLTRFPQGLAFGSIGLCLAVSWVYDKNTKALFRNAVILTSSFFITLVPFFIFNFSMYQEDAPNLINAFFRPLIAGSTAQSNLFDSVPGFLENLFFYPSTAIKQNWMLVFFILGAILLIVASKNFKDAKKRVILICLLVYMGYFTSIVNKQARFLIVMFPYMAIISSYAVIWLMERLREKERMNMMIKSAAMLFMGLFLLVAASFSIKEDGEYYAQLSNTEPPIVGEFYRFFTSHPVSGVILTSDPTPAAYSDFLFMPYYYSLDDALKVYDTWINNDKLSAIIFSPSSFPCLEGDSACESEKQSFISRINQNKEVFSKKYDDDTFSIYYPNRK